MSTTPTHRVPLCLEGAPRPGVWADRAACRNADTERFFATDDVSVAAARRLCRPCPVRAQCADYALCLPDLTGIWGGMTETERRRLRRAVTWLPTPIVPMSHGEATPVMTDAVNRARP